MKRIAPLFCGLFLASCAPATMPAPNVPFESHASRAVPLVNLSNWNDTSLWQKQNGYGNGGVFNVGWRADHAVVSGKTLDITLDNHPCPAGCSGAPFASDELDSTARYGYGTYTVRMQTAKASGVVSTFFTYVNLTPSSSSKTQTNDEIDVEIPGARTTTLEGTYYKEGGAGVEHTMQLPFESSAGMHTYAIRWLPDSIAWYADGKLLYTAHGSPSTMPTHPSNLVLNFWTGRTVGIVRWLGPFHYRGALHALYDYARFTPAP
ncbi:MAG: family 16 glycosylhydrolase [Candidatus Eremiobacteraeota bacterium]|nr:family 16 glycosylhydrolase [Candidatus Eremiobacteraeota bacterium]